MAKAWTEFEGLRGECGPDHRPESGSNQWPIQCEELPSSFDEVAKRIAQMKIMAMRGTTKNGEEMFTIGTP
jgi:hypothetical protein